MLENSKQTIRDNEEKHEEALNKIKAAHIQDVLQAKVKGWYKLGVGIAIGILAGGITVAILK